VRRLRWKGPVFTISALAREGLQPLVEAIWTHVAEFQREEPLPDPRFDEGAPASHG
jgi:GTP-binding protein